MKATSTIARFAASALLGGLALMLPAAAPAAGKKPAAAPAATRPAQGARRARNAKDLYYEPATPATPAAPVAVEPAVVEPVTPAAPVADPEPRPLPSRIGLKYKIVLKDLDGDVREVTERYRFSTGDRIRLVFESNIDGYVYIYQKGASTRGTQLFPDPRLSAGRNYIRRYTQFSIPPRAGEDRGWWKFDTRTGFEELFIFVSPRPIADLNFAVPASREVSDPGWTTVSALSKKLDKPGSKDISYEVEGPAAAPVSAPRSEEPSAAYVVSQTPMLLHHILLRHVN